jgi:hypothetical protein
MLDILVCSYHVMYLNVITFGIISLKWKCVVPNMFLCATSQDEASQTYIHFNIEFVAFNDSCFYPKVGVRYYDDL